MPPDELTKKGCSIRLLISTVKRIPRTLLEVLHRTPGIPWKSMFRCICLFCCMKLSISLNLILLKSFIREEILPLFA